MPERPYPAQSAHFADEARVIARAERAPVDHLRTLGLVPGLGADLGRRHQHREQCRSRQHAARIETGIMRTAQATVAIGQAVGDIGVTEHAAVARAEFDDVVARRHGRGRQQRRDRQRDDRHCDAAADTTQHAHITTTLAPTLTRPYRSMMSVLRMRMQPDDTFLPMSQGSFEPWIRYSVEPRYIARAQRGLTGPPGMKCGR